MRDPWALLGVSRGADDAAIKKAYRSLARELHPDRNKENPQATARFQDISRAYESIKTEADRDHWLAENEGGGLDEPLYQKPSPAEESQELVVDFRQAFSGAQIDVELPLEEVCSFCGGTGAAPGHAPRRCSICGGRGDIAIGKVSSPCSECQGRGYVVDVACQHCKNGLRINRRTISLLIPPGAHNGLVLSPADIDNVSFRIRVEPSPIFKQDFANGRDLLIEIPVTFSEALLGSAVRIPTPEKVVEIQVPPGTSSGKTFRIDGQGMPEVGGGGRGDLYAKIIVAVPEKPSRKQKSLAEELAREDDPASLRYPLFNPEA